MKDVEIPFVPVGMSRLQSLNTLEMCDHTQMIGIQWHGPLIGIVQFGCTKLDNVRRCYVYGHFDKQGRLMNLSFMFDRRSATVVYGWPLGCVGVHMHKSKLKLDSRLAVMFNLIP